MIGKIVKRDGKIAIERGWSGEGWIYKNEEAYEKDMNAVCYIPELSDMMYTGSDIVRICRGQKEIADRIFAAINWDHPESRLDDQGEELVECPCGALYWRYTDDGDEVEGCPYCKSSVEEADNFEKKCGRIPGKKVILHDSVSVNKMQSADEFIKEMLDKLLNLDAELYEESISLKDYARQRESLVDEFYNYFSNKSCEEIEELWDTKIADAEKQLFDFSLPTPGFEVLAHAFPVVRAFIDSQPEISTLFGPQNPKGGYRLSKLFIGDNFMRFDMYMLDRSIRENDDARGGDLVCFRLGYKCINCKLIFGEVEQIAREAIKSSFNSLYGKAEEVVL